MKILMGVCLMLMHALYAADKPMDHEAIRYVMRIAENNHQDSLANAIQEITEGFTGSHFGADFLNNVREKEKSQPTGEYVEYWPNGQLKVKAAYKNGRPEGHIHGWYDDGTSAFKGFFKEGVKQGVHMAFFPPEVTKTKRDGEVMASCFVYNEKGEADGEQQSDHPPHGRLHVLVEYRKGVLNGTCGLWNNGSLGEWRYKKGKLLPSKKKSRQQKNDENI